MGATNQRFQPGGDFNQGKGLTEIIVGAEAQPFHALAKRIASGEDQYRFAARFFTPFAQNIQPINTRQRQIEDHGIVWRRIERGFPFFSASEPINGEAHFPQPGFDAIADKLVIFHQ